MPLYEYICPEGHVTNVLERQYSSAGDNATVVICAECGQPARRKVSLPGIMEVKSKSRVLQQAIAQPWRNKR